MTRQHSRIEDRIRRALGEVADVAPVSPDAWDRTVARMRARQRPPGLLVGASLLVVVGLAVSGVLARGGDSDTLAVHGGSEGTVLRPLPPYEKPPVPDDWESRVVEGLWLLAGVEDDDRTLVVRVAAGNCFHFDYMTLEEASDDRIRLRAWNEEWQPTRDGQACLLYVSARRYRVELPEPVAGRAIEGECEPEADRTCQTIVDSIEAAREHGIDVDQVPAREFPDPSQRREYGAEEE